ncbi:MAG: hypothetical protein ACR2G2_02230 [Pseudonocardia sp.]
MAFRIIADSCPDGPCPRFVLDEVSGDVFVQGYLTDEQPVSLPTGEGFLRIPAAAWRDMFAQLRA